MKMTVAEAQENLETCRSRMSELKRQFDAEQQKAVFLQGYIQALSSDDEDAGVEESAPAPRLKAV